MEKLACRLLVLTFKANRLCSDYLPIQVRHSTSSAISKQSNPVGNAGLEKAQKINRAMKAYLERAQSYNVFMQEETAEYEIGKRHLANIMGADPDNFTQEDIDKAVEYLLPSGLFDKKARPKVKPPTEVIPRRKAAQFGVDGRPFNSFFYTGRQNFVQTLHDISMKMEELKKFEDSQVAQNITLDPSQQLQLAGSQWLEKKVLENKFQETLSEIEYKNFLIAVEYLSNLPYSFREKDFIFQFRLNLQAQTSSISQEILPLKYDESGRGFQEAEGSRKEARAQVKLFERGSGKVTINGRGFLEYFPRLMDREQIVFPLHFTDKLCSVDYEATVENGGPSGQAGAIRLALSRALQSMVSADMVEKMRLAGLLTRDPRTLERQKPGQQGARRKYTWKKR